MSGSQLSKVALVTGLQETVLSNIASYRATPDSKVYGYVVAPLGSARALCTSGEKISDVGDSTVIGDGYILTDYVRLPRLSLRRAF